MLSVYSMVPVVQPIGENYQCHNSMETMKIKGGEEF